MGPAELVVGALRLDPTAFDAVLADGGWRVAIAVLVAGGLSHAIGQSVALFALRVRPGRFLLALGVNALIFAGSSVAWAAALGLAAWGWRGETASVAVIISVVGLGHAPRLFGLFTLIPYFGALIGTGLTVWTLLAIAVGARTALSLDLTSLLLVLGSAWLLTQIVERTIGRPLVALARALRRWGEGPERPAPREGG